MHRVPFLIIARVDVADLGRCRHHASDHLSERARGAQRIVVGRVVGARPRASGTSRRRPDRVALHAPGRGGVKGGTVTEALVDVEGGTLGGLTLRVSDLPQMVTGDRAVFFLDPKPQAPGVDVPHLRGLGILKLDAENRVPHQPHPRPIRAAVQTPAR